MSVRVLVVDDSAFMRRVIRSMLESDAQIEVVGTANDGEQAIKLATSLKPDVITLDIEMPVMDGLTALRRIMRDCPTNVLMCSSLTTGGSLASLRALKLGAADVVAKDPSQFSLNSDDVKKDLITRIKAIARDRSKPVAKSSKSTQKIPQYDPRQFSLITIGSSTGGPPQLETILAALPSNFKIPIVIAQHMPIVFTQSMTQRLDDLCQLDVVHIEDGMSIEHGCIYVAPGGQHTAIRKKTLSRWTLEVGEEPKDHPYRPSVDALFTSAAETAGKRTLAIVLTGIGEDGMRGGKDLKKIGGSLLAQSEETCVVYGMPKAVAEAGLLDAALSAQDLGSALKSLTPATNANAA